MIGDQLEGYLALVLDPQSAELLKGYVSHLNCHCHHVTLIYRPTRAQLDRYIDHLGKAIEIAVTGLAADDKAAAVLVTCPLSRNVHPHITVSCAEGVERVYSNELIARALAQDAVKPLSIPLKGIVGFIPVFPK